MSDEVQEKPRTKVLSNGAIYDLEAKRIVANPGGGKNAITKETASEYHAKRQEKKRARIEAGALAAVQDKLPDAFTGDDGDWIEAVAQQVAYKALDKLDPKQVDAARFLFTEAGIAEQRQPVQGTAAEAVTDILREVASIAASLAQAANGFDNINYRKHEAIDGQTVEAGTDSGSGDAGEGNSGGG